jgi:hypothetical protein
MDINFRGMGTNYIFVDMYIWGSLTMANTYTHGYKYSLNSYSRGLIQSSKSMKISLPRIIMISVHIHKNIICPHTTKIDIHEFKCTHSICIVYYAMITDLTRTTVLIWWLGYWTNLPGMHLFFLLFNFF